VALALALAVPAFAAPAEWRTFPSFSSLFDEAQTKASRPMGFEIAGESFPGSAFYYLADEPHAPLAGGTTLRDAGLPALDEDNFIGAAARPMRLGGTSLDKARALQCMTLAIYYEAATESDAGQRAVAQVVLNRVAHPTYPNTVCGVVFQGSERTTGCQFSFTCDGSLARQPSRSFWERAQRVALQSLAGSVYKPVGLATHYHTVQIHPYWADSLHNLTTIGAHTFYRWKGAAGLSAAFSTAYIGGEPLPARHTPSKEADRVPVADPLDLARMYEQSLAAAPASTAAGAPSRDAGPAPRGTAVATTPAYSAAVQERGGDGLYVGSKLPGGGDVKDEYSQSGQWIAR